MSPGMKTVGKKYHLTLGTVAAALVLVFGVYLPQTRKMKAFKETATPLQMELDARTARLQTTVTTYAEARRSERKVASLEEAVPREDRIGQFLESLDRIAHQCALADKNVVPAAVIESDEVSCLPIEMNFSGDFEAVHEFLRRVESLPRVARVQRMELTSADEGPLELVSSVTMHVYFRPS